MPPRSTRTTSEAHEVRGANENGTQASSHRWLVDEIRESLPKELDFLTEAKNSGKCLESFWKFSPHIANTIYASRVYWDLSTSKLLTKEFMDGAQISDVKTIRRLGIHPHEVSTLGKQNIVEMPHQNVSNQVEGALMRWGMHGRSLNSRKLEDL